MTEKPNLPYDLRKPEDVKDYLQNVETEYSFQCFHEKQPEGCHRLGTFYELVSKDFQRSAKMYKRNCYDNKYGPSCYKIGQFHIVGKGGQEKSLEKSFEHHKLGCEADIPHGAACDNAGLMCIDKQLQKNDLPLAAKFFEKGCSLRDGRACMHAAQLYLKGEGGVVKDLSKALDLSVRACNSGLPAGCYNAAVMYRRGDGVAQSDEQFSVYKNKYVELNKAEKTSDSVTFS